MQSANSKSEVRSPKSEAFAWIVLACLLIGPAAFAQPRPYIGFVYPAGGQQGTTFQIRLGGQGLDEVSGVLVTGSGVTARITENYRRLNTQEMQLLNEQLRVLRSETLSNSAPAEEMMMTDQASMTASISSNAGPARASGIQHPESKMQEKQTSRALMDKIERRTSEYVPTPACPAIASLVLVEIAVASDAEPGEREIRLVTLRGVSNPLVFEVGQVPEFTRKPMTSAILQVLGKEAQSLRKRLPSEVEDRLTLPCTANGQIASGEVNRYRFGAIRGQRLVINTLARQLVPFIADAVPGWFQPVLVLYDSEGKEVAYDDDYRFQPDPTIFYEVPKDGEYVLAIRDSLYRGREDFVYRVTIGEVPFITSVFPLGGRTDAAAKPELRGWNLEGSESSQISKQSESAIWSLTASKKGLVSNRRPFALGNLVETLDQEPNNSPAAAQKVTLPVVVNGRIDRADDWDVFQFAGKADELVVGEVQARRLDSPLDSVLKLTDAAGNLLAYNDDYEDLGAGIKTHHADSYFMVRLPADGTYYVHIGDIGRQGGPEYAYRLRISPPQPDFALRVVPSSLSLRSKSAGTLTVYAQRKDGFSGSIKLALKDAPDGFSAAPVTLLGTQAIARINIKTTLTATKEPVTLTIVGTATVSDQTITHEAVPAEDKMQAFLWRHLVPAQDLRVLVFDPKYQPAPMRIAKLRPPPTPSAVTNTSAATNVNVAAKASGGTNAAAGTNAPAVEKPKFTKQQVAARLRQLKLLFEEGMLKEDFYAEKVAECEAGE